MLVLVRHGRTAWNLEGRFQGRADIPLDEEGRTQAERVAAELAVLADRPPAGRPGPVVLSSDLSRARATAVPVAAALGAPLIVDAALREVDVGAWEGLTRAEAEARYPEQYRLWAAGVDVRRGGGETLAEAGRRVAARIGAALAGPGPSDGLGPTDGLGPSDGLGPTDAPGPPHGANDPSARTVIVVGHGMSLQAATAVLRDRGLVHFDGDPPHLGNACFLLLPQRPDQRADARRPT